MGKQCWTQWDLKWNVSFGSWTALFDLAWYAEKLGLLNGCDELTLSVKWMPMRLSPVHVLWTYAAVFSLVSKICALRHGRECSAFSCCAGTALSEMLGVGQVAQKEFLCGRRRSMWSVVFYTSLSRRNQILLPTEEKLQVCPSSSHFSFLEILWIIKYSTGEDLNLCCLKAAWPWLYSILISYYSSNYCFFSCYPACKIRGLFVVFLLAGLKVASCFRQTLGKRSVPC